MCPELWIQFSGGMLTQQVSSPRVNLPAGGQGESITSDPLCEKVSTAASSDFLVSSLYAFMNLAKND